MFEYSLLGSELKNQTEIAKKQHQRSHKYHRFGKKDDEKINKKITLKNCKETDLINNELTIRNKSSFYKYHDINKFKRNYTESKF